MTCYASYFVGVSTLALVLYDLVEGLWDSVLTHGVIGGLITSILWLLCIFVNDGLALAVLVIPTVVFISFSLGILMTGESLKRQGCCVTCGENNDNKNTADTNNQNCVFDEKLKAKPLM